MKNKVSDWMTGDPITIDHDASIIDALHIMRERNIRRLPVMKHGRLVGIVTDRMLKDYSPGKATYLDTWEVHYLLSKTPVTEAMNANPQTIGPDALLTEAVRQIRDHKLYGLSIVDEKGDLIGVFTIKDMIEALFYLADLAEAKAK